MVSRKGLLGWLLVVTLCVGCSRVFGSSGPTEVSRGSLFSPGVADFDVYFRELHELQTAAGPLPSEVTTLETELALALGGDRLTSRKLLEGKLGQGVEQLNKNGIFLTLTFSGLPTEEDATEEDEVPTDYVARRDGGAEVDARVTVDGGPAAGEDEKFVRAVERAAVGAARLIARSHELSRRVRILKPHTEQLERRVDAEFRLLGPARTSDVKRNLFDAKPALNSLGTVCEQAFVDTSSFVEMLDRVVKAGQAPPKDDKKAK